MKRINSLNDLLMEELSNLLSAENQLLGLLPNMVKACDSESLKSALAGHHTLAKEHITRLLEMFSNIGQHPQGLMCKAMKGLAKECDEEIINKEKGPSNDAATVRVAQRIEHYLITAYGRAGEHAVDLGHTKIQEIMNKAVDEERDINLHLNELAQGMINSQAIVPGSSERQSSPQENLPKGKKETGFYIQEDKFRRGNIKKKSRNPDVSRFISEGNPNIQETEKGDDLKDSA